jgi:cytochrome bd-type quinol oxidase subunit 1
MELGPVLLSRLQFAWVVGWHILLPPSRWGLRPSSLFWGESLRLFTGREVYGRISTFWIKIFAIAFGMGVVTGIVTPFQFGTNWSRSSDATANVLSSLLAYEGLTAFFLEAGFLGVLLFGRERVPPWAYFVSALMVAMGTLFSSFWILAVNSWMQTPAGYEIVNGQFFSKDWFEVIFNPSFPYRLAHVVVGFFVTAGAFFAPVPLATAAVAWLTWRALGRSEAQATPFLGAIGLRALLSRNCHQPLSNDGTAPFHTVAGDIIRPHAGLPDCRHARAAARGPHVYRVVILGVPRQGPQRDRLPLIQFPFTAK